MATYQTGRQIAVNYKAETTYGTLPGTGGAKVFRPSSGALNLTKNAIQSNENRRDGMMTRSRHGSRSLAGQYGGDLSLGAFDDLIEAQLRGTFDAGLSLTGMSVAVDSAGKTFTRAAGSWIADGVRVGDVVRFGAFTAGGAANNARNLRVTALTSTVMTVADTPTTIAQQTGITMTRPKKVIQGVVPRSFTFEEAELDIDGSEIGTGVRLGQMQIQLQPDGMATVTFDFVGQDMQVMTGAQSPYFLAPTTTVSIGMTAVEAVIRLGTEDIVDLTALSIGINLNAAGVPVVGSLITPDVFTNLANVSASVTALRKDFTRVQNFINEDQLSLHLLLTENESEPKDFCSFFMGNLSLSGATKSALGADGPRTQELPMLVGIDDRGGAYHPSMLSFQTSAP